MNTYTPNVYHVEYVIGYPAQFGLGDAIRNTSQENLKELGLKITKTFGDHPVHNFKTTARFDTLISGIKYFVDTQSIDLIVMGTKGATGANEILFGSNTVLVLKEIKCQILAIPPNFEYETPHDILFPTDLEVQYKDSQLSILKNIVDTLHSRINAMHIATGYDLTEAQNTNKSNLESFFHHAAYLFHDVRSMNITEAINQFQVKHKINLLAMINNKHSFYENLFFRNAVNQIGYHLNIPFLVIPSKV